MQSLACGKFKVLVKQSKGKDVADDDVFAFNKDFKAKLIRLKINMVQVRLKFSHLKLFRMILATWWIEEQVKETKEEQKETNERVYREREHMIDAAVVRIMKSRQTITHRELMSETMHALSSLFSAEVRMNFFINGSCVSITRKLNELRSRRQLRSESKV